ncbi:MAG: xanthine dehydrogenase family protein molybdopterin-binding subunit, partial [Eubacteriaceae bacterium]|nr:xanthine dehydrogenase family protein molybdopterin-binding subunit [Eubacteriaceae bacterium]
MDSIIGKDIYRKEAYLKVTGQAKYTDDYLITGIYHAKLLTSKYAHANIKSIDTSQAMKSQGVKAVITGDDVIILCGSVIEDMPPLAKGKVRYYGEPVAIVVATSEQFAKAALSKIDIEYEMLPIINSVTDALKENSALVHENLMQYKKAVVDVYPEAGTNICNRVKIRKGDILQGFKESYAIVEGSFSLPQSDHAAMETRCCQCEILADGKVFIRSSSQAPFSIKKMISEYFNIPDNNVIVHVPFVGGGFGGKAAVQIEILAYIASNFVGGHAVKIANEREQDIVTSPCHLGLEAKIKLGADKNGKITAAEMYFNVDVGAYAETGPRMTKAMAVDCAGPYNFENIWCDCLSVYTNHPYVTSFRGFGHEEYTFCLERMMDKLAAALGMDSFDIRRINALKEGDYTPTQAKVTVSNTGNLPACLDKLRELIKWDEGIKISESDSLIKVKGIACFSKTSDSPTDAGSSVLLTFNIDGSININCGVVEYGPGMKTTAAQILAEKMKMDISKIHVKMDVDTQTSPKHWKTVASMTTYMLGRAILKAADDLIWQLLNIASIALKCPSEELDYGNENVFVKADPSLYVAFKDIVHGYQYPNGNSIGGQITGRGSFIMSNLSYLNTETGYGKAGPYWTVGAQAVEIEYDKDQHTYRVIKAATVIDAGKVLNPKTSKGVVMGGILMGLGLAVSEAFKYNINGIVQDTSFRTYKMMRISEAPEYLVDFVETPCIESPYGARGIAEHGILGIPAAVANAISLAEGID